MALDGLVWQAVLHSQRCKKIKPLLQAWTEVYAPSQQVWLLGAAKTAKASASARLQGRPLYCALHLSPWCFL